MPAGSLGLELQGERETINKIVGRVVQARRAGAKRRRSSVEALIAELTAPQYLVLNKHPAHEFKDRLFRADLAGLSAFLREEFCKESLTGVDIVIATSDLD
jgi:hypothetical protein